MHGDLETYSSMKKKDGANIINISFLQKIFQKLNPGLLLNLKVWRRKFDLSRQIKLLVQATVLKIF